MSRRKGIAVRRARLRSFLILFSLAAVAIAAGLVGSAGVALLRRLGDQEARGRVLLGVDAVVGALERSAERRARAARQLSNRPTLERALASADEDALRRYLESYQRSGGFSACAALLGDRIISQAGSPAPWEALWAERSETADRFLLSPFGSPTMIMGAWAPVAGVPGGSVGVAELLDESFVRWTASKVGLEVEIINLRRVRTAGSDPRADLRLAALEAGEAVSGRIDALDVYLAVTPLRDPDGEIMGVVEVALPRAAVEGSLDQLTRRLLTLTLAAGGVAVLLSLVLSRFLALPLERLSEAASRIGRGDLSSPVPRVGGAEPAALAATMEEMRERLLYLTRELRRRRDESEAVLSGISDGVFAVDRERRIRYLNPQVEKILGLGREQALGRFCGDVLNPEKREGRRTCEDSCPIVHARFRGSTRATEHLQLRSGERRTVVITSSPPSSDAMEGSADAPQQMQVLRDETEIEASRLARDAILANISHEFRSPLSAQHASLELLRDRLPELSRDEIQQLILSLERGTLRLTRLIDNLLESTRIESGQTSIRHTALQLDHVVEEAVEMVAPLIEQRGQRLEVKLPYPLPALRGDGPRLVQVLVNLLANANKFSPAESAITIGGEVEPDSVAIWVEDEGGGLPEGTRETLFERFVRSGGGEPEQRGIGLGLWIVKSIVERHGGAVEAISTEAGTRMRVTLPSWRKNEDPGG